jgi:hypothetical protein
VLTTLLELPTLLREAAVTLAREVVAFERVEAAERETAVLRAAAFGAVVFAVFFMCFCFVYTIKLSITKSPYKRKGFYGITRFYITARIFTTLLSCVGELPQRSTIQVRQQPLQ